MAFCKACAKFCGKFEDKHFDDGGFDAEDGADKDESRKPKDYHKIMDELHNNQGFGKKVASNLGAKKGLEGLGGLSTSDAMAVKAWAKHQTTVAVEEAMKGGGSMNRYADAIVVHDEKLRPAMLKKLRTFQSLHTIELVNCKLKDCPPMLTEIEPLRSLRLSQNHIKNIRRDLTRSSQNKSSSLQRIRIDENKLDMIEMGTLSHDAVRELLVLNFNKNLLAVLPHDFLLGASSLEILELSFNKIESLPESILDCVSLRILDLCNNQLTALPENIDRLKKLRKLFTASNQLTSLPEKIGGCSELEKMWVSDNKLRYLPYSVIKLWKDEGGNLEDIMVDGNPLVVPSVTAFSMGGPGQMFRLFKEHVRDEEERNRKKQEQAKKLALADAAAEPQLALRDVASPGDGELALTADEGHASAPRAHDGETLGSAHGADPEVGALALTGASPRDNADDKEDYYFSPAALRSIAEYKKEKDKTRSEDEIRSMIRSAESSVMLLKRQIYVDRVRELAKTRAVEAKKRELPVPQKIQDLLEVNVNTFRGKVHITELDIFFCLLVTSAKTLSSTCESLFTKFLQPGQGDMDRKSWDLFCARVPAALSDEMKSAVWRLMSWKTQEQDGGKVDIIDFVAAMHVHDIGEKDSFVMRMASVLKLKYYSMGMEEFETKIRRRGNDTSYALESVDFPSDDDEPAEKAQTDIEDGELLNLFHEGTDEVDHIPTVEGERHMASATQQALLQSKDAKTSAEQRRRKPMISMTEAQYCQIHNVAEAEDEPVNAAEGQDFSSTELSKGDTSESPFEAEDCIQKIQALEKEKAFKEKKVETKQVFKIKAEHDLAKLMTLPPSEIVRTPAKETEGGAAEESIAETRKKEREREKLKKEQKKQGSMSSQVRDPRFGTSMMGVRRAIRDAYRNLPYNEFVALINFLLRGLKHIKHFDAVAHITYWHKDDPVLRHLMGSSETNKYPTAVLTEMGFVRVLDSYWVWPDKHMRHPGMKDDEKKEKERIISRLVDKNCLGLEKMRLDDLIKLISHCRTSLDRAGKAFTGHCKAN